MMGGLGSSWAPWMTIGGAADARDPLRGPDEGPWVSCVLLTTHPKRSHLLGDALLSYQLQTYPWRELIVVSDGDPLVAGRDDVTVVNLPSGTSIGAKRNAGLAAARGTYLATWDDDDFSMPERLARQVEVARHGASLVRSRCMWIADERFRLVDKIANFAGPTALIHAPSARRAGGYPDKSYGEDLALYLSFLLGHHHTVSLDETFYVMRRHDTNVSTRLASESLDTLRRRAVASDDLARTQARLDALLTTPRAPLLTPPLRPPSGH